jgi:hypothetical protein
MSPTHFWRRHARNPQAPGLKRALELLEGQYARHLMLASCAFFFDDLDRLEPRNSIANGLRAIHAVAADERAALETEFRTSLSAARSWRTGRSGADLLADVAARQPVAA